MQPKYTGLITGWQRAGFILLTLALAAVTNGGGVAADTLTEIKSKGSIEIFAEAQYPPFEFVDQTGKIVGLDVDLAEKVFGPLGVKLNFTDVSFSGLLPALLQKKADAIVSGITITPERMEKFDFSVPYTKSGYTAVVRADDKRFNSLDDLSGAVIGAQTGTTQIDVANEFEQTALKAKGKPGFSEIKTYGRSPLAFEDLLNERLDAVIEGQVAVIMLLKERPGKFRILDNIGPGVYYGMVFRKGDESLVNYANEQIRKMKKDGTLAAIHQKWLGESQVDQLPDPWRDPWVEWRANIGSQQ
jgi:polar amino acid transport system substrate-binding protein